MIALSSYVTLSAYDVAHVAVYTWQGVRDSEMSESNPRLVRLIHGVYVRVCLCELGDLSRGMEV